MWCVSHITILPVFTCMMNARDQMLQACVTSFSPWCDRPSKFVHRPRNVQFPNTSQIQTYHNNLWTTCRQFSCWLIFLFFKLMAIHASRSDFLKLLSRFIRRWKGQEEIVSASGFPEALVGSVSLATAGSWIWTYLCSLSQFPFWFDTLWGQPKNGQGMFLVFPNQSLSWVFSKSDWYFLFCLPVWYRRLSLIGKSRFSQFMNKQSQPGTFRDLFCRTFSTWLSLHSPAEGWPYRFRSRGTTEYSILTREFGHLCFGRRIQITGDSDFGIFNNVGASLILTWVQADTASAACPEHLLQLSFEMLMILVEWTPCLCTFDTEVPAPSSWDDRDPAMT